MVIDNDAREIHDGSYSRMPPSRRKPMSEEAKYAKNGHTRIANAEFVIEATKGFGVEPSPQSRLMKMRSVLQKSNGRIPPPEHPDFEIALESVRDMQLLVFAFNQGCASSGNAKFKEKLKTLNDDVILPQNNRQRSQGRDVQFELFVAAICRATQFEGFLFAEPDAEPDVRCDVAGVQIGIAAKRIKSESQVEKRIREAVSQIDKSGIPGIIAVETNVLLNRDNTRIDRPISDRVFGPIYKEAMESFLHQYDTKIRQWTRHHEVLGLIFHDHQVRRAGDSDWSLDSMTTRFRIAEDALGKVLFECFEDYYLGTLPNVRYL